MIEKRHVSMSDKFLRSNPSITAYKSTSLNLRQDLTDTTLPQLGTEAARKAIADWGPCRRASDITHLVVCTTSSGCMPGADFEVVKLLGLPLSTKRFMLYQVGCHGGGLALRLAKDLAENNHNARVLVICSEVTPLALRGPSQNHLGNLVGQAIFGDAACAAIVGARTMGGGGETPLFEIVSTSQDILPGTAGGIVAKLDESGIVYNLRPDMPLQISNNIEELVKGTLARARVAIEDWSEELFWVVHPGGRKILDAVESTLGLRKEKLEASREVMRRHGNTMSSCVLITLEEMRRRSADRGLRTPGEGLDWGLLFGFGPGITVETILLHAQPQRAYIPLPSRPPYMAAAANSNSVVSSSMVVVPRMKLGSQGLEVSALGLGCMGMSYAYGPAKPEPEMVKLIHHAVAAGVTFLDTSDFYGPHTNELLLGKALMLEDGGGVIREKVQLATKFAVSYNGEGKMEVHGDPAYVRAACEGSLRRLGVDCIDLYYQHRVDTTVPIEVTMSEMKKLVEEGKIKYIGLCEASPSTIRRAHAVHPITAVQLEWSIWARDLEDEIVPTCRELGIGIVAYSPLGRGFFSVGAKLAESLSEQDVRKKIFPRFDPANLEKNAQIFERVNSMATRKGCTPSQLALAWVCHQGNDVCPIPGTTKVENFNQNIGALSVKLTPEEMKELESYATVNDIHGDRYLLMGTTWKYAESPPLSSWNSELPFISSA